MSRAIVEGRAIWLCLDHATAVVIAMPETFEEMRALFVQPAATGGYPIDTSADRRSPIDRRRADDRRVFPPRPEGRRASFGRRAGDPLD
jgi:hypothetical protein